MDTSILSAAFQVVVGGELVFIAGILIGRSRLKQRKDKKLSDESA